MSHPIKFRIGDHVLHVPTGRTGVIWELRPQRVSVHWDGNYEAYPGYNMAHCKPGTLKKWFIQTEP